MKREPAIYQYFFYARAVLIWIFKCRFISDFPRIKNNQIREVAFLYQSPVFYSE